MTAKKKPQKIKSMTIDEFKTYIEGMSFMNDDWVPNQAQWEQIKLLIANLKGNTVVQHVVAPQHQHVGGGVQFPQQPQNQGEAFAAGETIDPRAAGQRNFLGGQQPMGGQQSRQAVDRNGNLVATNPKTTERIGSTTVLPSAMGEQSEFL